jgi:hypothetical protein
MYGIENRGYARASLDIWDAASIQETELTLRARYTSLSYVMAAMEIMMHMSISET